MSLTGRNNLAEGPLLQRLGDLRWRHLAEATGIPSRLIVDQDSQRLYTTFYFVELAFPERRPLASFGENDRILLLSRIQRYGRSMIDGITCLLPEAAQEPDPGCLEAVERCTLAGVPAARLSNVFVAQYAGSEWLKKSRPASASFDRVPETALAPDSYALVRQAQQEGSFALPGKTYTPLTDGPVEAEYRLAPDRDLNGAGLVYFANYPVFLDIAERQVLETAGLRLSDEQIDSRTLVRRRSAYLNNASARDTLGIEVRAWVENPFLARDVAPEMAPVRLFFNFQMRRRSDDRLMMVSTAEKIVFGKPMEEVPFFADLAKIAAG
jgi:probable biosynthetic protein (TIGR04098 family)